MSAATKPVRVLQILTCDTNAGTEIMVAGLVESMDPGRVTSAVVILDAPGPILARLQATHVPVRSLGGRGFLVATARLARVLRAERFDVVNAYGFKATLAARILVRLARRPRPAFVSGVRGLHVTECESIASPKARFALAVDRLASPLVDVYDANSTGALELLASAGVARKRLRYIPNGIDTTRWPGPVDRAGREGPPIVLCVARFIPRKRHQDLLRASRILLDRGLEHRIVLAGYGPTLEDVRRQADELRLNGAVTFSGRVDRDAVHDLLAEADVFCLASSWEGMAGTVMEGMAAALPIVGTDVNGIADLVRSGETGLLVPPGRPEQLADALAELLGDPERRRSMGRESFALVEREFSLEQMVGAKEALYRELAGTA